MGIPVFCVKHQKIHECDYNKIQEISQRNENNIKSRMQRILNPEVPDNNVHIPDGGINGILDNARTRSDIIKNKVSGIQSKISEDETIAIPASEIQSKMDLLRARVMGGQEVKNTEKKLDGELQGLAKKAADAYKKTHKELLDKINKTEDISKITKKSAIKEETAILKDEEQKYITVEQAKKMIKSALSKVVKKEIDETKKKIDHQNNGKTVKK
ncbi:hypothetical protein [Spiroplasma endosymbiont of Amphibalanus improvisus]|uniref:hypothetical protein n=1 Tax=Spiroplasma endosymbiont of Amphibalanus improvisus TaxID=3066327 RepID=UPI00313D4FB9